MFVCAVFKDRFEFCLPGQNFSEPVTPPSKQGVGKNARWFLISLGHRFRRGLLESKVCSNSENADTLLVRCTLRAVQGREETPETGAMPFQ